VYISGQSEERKIGMQGKIIGLSYFLHSKAEGHFFSVHSRYHIEFEKRGYKSVYLGQANIPKNTYWINPELTYNPIELKGLGDRINIQETYRNIGQYIEKNDFIYIFEGNLTYWFMIALLCNKYGITAHVNLIRSDLIIKDIEENDQEFKKWMKICSKISGENVTVSVLNQKLAQKMKNVSNIQIDVVPTFSGLNKELVDDLKRSFTNYSNGKVLVAAPYPTDLEILSKTLDLYPDLIDKILVSTWVDKPFDFIKHPVEISNKHLTDLEYCKSIIESKHLVLLYTNIFHIYGSSSKIYDAALLGKQICVPLGTSASEQITLIADHYIFDSLDLGQIRDAIVNPIFIAVAEKQKVPDEREAVNFLVDERREFKKNKLLIKILAHILDFLLNKQAGKNLVNWEDKVLFRILKYLAY
jgi:hypothetical protein